MRKSKRMKRLKKISNEFQVGDVVMKLRESFEMENKLDEKWIGPYLVTKKFDEGAYEIQDPTGRKFRYNARKLQRMENSDPEEWVSNESGCMLPDDHNSCMIIATI